MFVLLLLHLGRNFATHGGRSLGQRTEEEKGQNGRQVQTKNGRDNATKEVQIGVGDGVDGLKRRETLSLWEPTKQDTGCNNKVVLILE